MSDSAQEQVDSTSWMRGYAPPSGYYDELQDSEGNIRPHWQKLSGLFGKIGPTGWASREEQLGKHIREHGITYNVYGEDEDKLRPWNLDLLPLALSQSEFNDLEAALTQRAHLFNLILQDVYGRQTMLQNGKMDPYLVFANPSFLRPCHGLVKGRQRHLHLYAADISRAPDGKWWVLADRTDAASGLGYALENRILMSRIFPKVIWDAEIHSLQPFIQAFCRYVEHLARRNTDNPNVAVLTAGPKNETYFEQSFLARNLGYALAEGDDLTVRSNRLYLKTISGVQPVDVLWRRVDSSWCDPLELRNESLIGVPGLLNASRQGNLSIINVLGSGFVETPAMLAFLPWFCRNYLGENLLIPSVATWWCGEKKELDYVIDNLDRLVVKPTFWGHHSKSYFGPLLSKKEREELVARMRSRPREFCGQEIVSNATIPIYRNGSMQSRQFQLRVFLVPEGNSWRMMPGGLVRYAVGENDLTVSMQRGGESKDAWVLRDKTAGSLRSARATASTVISGRRNSNDLPSRTADNLYWLGRYVERTESQARLLRSLDNLLINEIGSSSPDAILPFVEQIAAPASDLSGVIRTKARTINLEKIEEIVRFATYERENAESLISNLGHIHRAAGKVKERLSVDTWRRLLGLSELVQQPELDRTSIFDDALATTLDRVLDSLAGFIGNLTENMTRSPGWLFLQTGRRIERGLSIIFLLKGVFASEAIHSEALLSSLLEWADSSITYRRRYLNALQAVHVLDLLCFDDSNPRSLAYQAEGLRTMLASLPHRQLAKRHPIDTITLRIYSRLGLAEPATLLKGGKKNSTKSMDVFLESLKEEFLSLSLAIEQHYFVHTSLLKEPSVESFIG